MMIDDGGELPPTSAGQSHKTAKEKFFRARSRRTKPSKQASPDDKTSTVVTPNNIRGSLSLLKLPEHLSKIQLLEEILQTLNEKNIPLFERIVFITTASMSHAILKETKEIEENGGQFFGPANKRRTAGGVFISVLKQRLTEDQIHFIWKEQNEQQTKEKREKKKRRASMGALDQELEPLLQTERKKQRRESQICEGGGETPQPRSQTSGRQRPKKHNFFDFDRPEEESFLAPVPKETRESTGPPVELTSYSDIP